MNSMTKDKATITVDRSKVDRVREITGAANTSQAIDVALNELIRLDRLRRDVAAYSRIPPSPDEIALAGSPPDWADLADATDWEAVYGDKAP